MDPAAYNLRLAAVDAGGRRGSVEHTVKAALLTAGGLEISDLVLAPSSAGGAVRPAVDLELAGGGLSALLELAGRDPARLARATVAIELAESAEGRALLRAPVAAGARQGRHSGGPDGDRRRPSSPGRLRRPGGGVARGEAGGGRDSAVPGRSATGRSADGARPARRPARRDEGLRPGRAADAGNAGPLHGPARRARPGPRSRRCCRRDRGRSAGPARGRGGPPRRRREGRRPRGLPARGVVLRARQPARRPDAAPGGFAPRLGALPGGGLHGSLLRRQRQGPRCDRGLADGAHRRGRQPGAVRAPRRRPRPGEGAGSGGGDPE